MAKFECRIPAAYAFDDVLRYFHDHLRDGASASYEGGSDYQAGNLRVALRVYERYTIMGDNRLSLTMMLVGSEEHTFVSAITAAGGGGVSKLVGWGEDGFLRDFIRGAQQFEGMEIVST